MGHSKSMLLAKWLFLTPLPSQHVTLCHFFSPSPSLKSGRHWHEMEGDFFVHMAA